MVTPSNIAITPRSAAGVLAMESDSVNPHASNRELHAASAPVGPPVEPAPETPVYRSEDLFHGVNEVWIVHAGKTYRLLRTRNQKLILVK